MRDENEVAGADSGPTAPYPLRLDGRVIKGFGRGSKELGIPTANIPITGLTIGGHSSLENGVYYGFCGISACAATNNKPAVYDFVASIGYNPFYKNEKRSIEIHVLEKFKEDFYGSHMNVVVLGYIRPERDYDSLEALVGDIKFDCEVARRSLAREAYKVYKKEEGLLDFEGKTEEAS